MERILQPGVMARIDRLADRDGARIATAEVVTGGLVAAALTHAPSSSSWLLGGVIAHSQQVQRDVLCIRPGLVDSERAVLDMADGVALLLGATTAVAVAGELAPDGAGAGEIAVWFAVRHRTTTLTECHRVAGDRQDIGQRCCSVALDLLLRGLTDDG